MPLRGFNKVIFVTSSIFNLELKQVMMLGVTSICETEVEIQTAYHKTPKMMTLVNFRISSLRGLLLSGGCYFLGAENVIQSWCT